MSHIAIVLLNYNSTRYTRSCVKSLVSTRHRDDQQTIVVWDCNSKKDKPTISGFPECDLVLSSTNDGFSRGYNQAISYTIKKHQPDYLVILNNDTRVGKHAIHLLAKECESRQGKAIIAPKIYFEHGHEFYPHSYRKDERGHVLWYAGGVIDRNNMIPFHRGVDEVDRGQFQTVQETEFVSGCCFCLTPQLWKRIGGFDEKYFLYYEDVDLSLRAKILGIELKYYPKAKIYHINAGSTSGSGSGTHRYFQTRNRLRFGLRYGSLRSKLALLKEAWRFWKQGSAEERLGVLHALEGKWGNQSTQTIKV